MEQHSAVHLLLFDCCFHAETTTVLLQEDKTVHTSAQHSIQHLLKFPGRDGLVLEIKLWKDSNVKLLKVKFPLDLELEPHPCLIVNAKPPLSVTVNMGYYSWYSIEIDINLS